jgi:hypothetical protein
MKGLSFSFAIIQYPNVITMSSKIIAPKVTTFPSPARDLPPRSRFGEGRGEGSGKYFPPPSRGRLEGGWDLPEQYNYVFSIMVSLVIV